MNKKMVRGIIILIALICIAGVFLLVQHERVELEQLKKDDAESDKVAEEHKQKQPIADNGPPPDEPGFKWVRHGDHWDKVPLSEPNETPTAQPAPPSKTYDGPLTFHEELLKTNPVEALYQQTLERGHWSARHIPTFPPDDQEAATLARNIYLRRYYRSLGQTRTPEYQKLSDAYMSMRRNRNHIEDDARRLDLFRLSWIDLPEEKIAWEWFIEDTNFSLPFRP